ncbi:hypothetical protein F8C76_13560 [Flagellimonas olearia]|uniref:O-antigen ligase-related domain-containing protein n=1 Tax=Flagellimonas olearia TaxID=552546 RepID=A0A6I1DZV4_9FLAO|nr:hypothetical protein F8C76_13560 [Allomuricauda olearia]
MNNTIQYLLLAILISIFSFLPFANSSAYADPTIVSKTLFFVYGLILLSIPFVWFVFFAKANNRFQVSRIDLCLWVWLCYVVLNRYLFQSHYGFSIRFIELIGLSFLYIVIRTIPLRLYGILLLAIIASGLLQAIYGIVQLTFLPPTDTKFGIVGSFFNPGPYAGFLASVWPLALGCYLFKKEIVSELKKTFGPTKVEVFGLKVATYAFNHLSWIGLLTILIVLPSTRSRAAWLAVLTSSLLLILIKIFQVKKIRTWKSIPKYQLRAIILSTLIISGVGLFALYHYKSNSANGRILVWEVCADMIKKAPALGVGFDRFGAHYMDFQANYFEAHINSGSMGLADDVRYPYNEILQIVVENGFLGLLPFVAILFFLVTLPGKAGTIGQMFKGVLLSIFIFGLFSYPSHILPIKAIGVVSLAFLSSKDIHPFYIQIKRKLPSWATKSTKVALGVGILLLTIQLIRYTKTLELGYKNWKRALVQYDYAQYSSSVDLFGSASSKVLHTHGDFLMQYGKALVMSKDYEKGLITLKQSQRYLNNTITQIALGDAYKALGHFTEAEMAYALASKMVPSRHYPQYLMVKLYQDTGEYDKARKAALTFLSKPVKIPSKAIREMTNEINEIINEMENKSRI